MNDLTMYTLARARLDEIHADATLSRLANQLRPKSTSRCIGAWQRLFAIYSDTRNENVFIRLTTRGPRYRLRMDIDWSAEIVDQIESHWRHRLKPRLDGLTDAEYLWQPVPDCWTISRRGESSAPISFGAGEFTMDYAEPPHEQEPVTTIAWRLGHIIVNFASTLGKRFGGPAVSESTFCYAGTAKEALKQLDEQYENYVDGVRSIGTAGLAQPQGDPPAFAHAPVAKKILYGNVEAIHHGAEICLLRDLYLRNGSGTSQT